MAGDLRLNVDDYFSSLSESEQDRSFTGAGAKVIREGADPTRVVNARRGMEKSQGGRLARRDVFGQRVFTTTESTTKRGLASRRRTGRKSTVRLMPESLVEIAEDPADLARLLRVHGYTT